MPRGWNVIPGQVQATDGSEITLALPNNGWLSGMVAEGDAAQLTEGTEVLAIFDTKSVILGVPY